MGLSVWNQVDTDQYFSISTIDKKKMAKYGVKMSIAQLKIIARCSPPVTQIPTGGEGRIRMTKIYRYKDFATEGGGKNAIK